jgi:hypothetical protein
MLDGFCRISVFIPKEWDDGMLKLLSNLRNTS